MTQNSHVTGSLVHHIGIINHPPPKQIPTTKHLMVNFKTILKLVKLLLLLTR